MPYVRQHTCLSGTRVANVSTSTVLGFRTQIFAQIRLDFVGGCASISIRLARGEESVLSVLQGYLTEEIDES
jgi:hypothetical protein